MTAKELSQLYWLNREIEREKQRLSELEAAEANMEARSTGAPHMAGISDKAGIEMEIAIIREIIQKRIELSVIEYARLNRYIASIDDSLMRQIMTLRYINGMAWNQVADRLGTNENMVREAHSRFLKKAAG